MKRVRRTSRPEGIDLALGLALVLLGVAGLSALSLEGEIQPPGASVGVDPADRVVAPADGVPAPVTRPVRFTVLHTNDLHSQLAGLGPDSLFTAAPNDGDPVRGHVARLMTTIRSVRAQRRRQQEPVLLVDAGDSLFGSLFHVLGPIPQSAWVPEYAFFHAAGYDALGLGNHDFDADEKGLALAWQKAQRGRIRLPYVCSNAVVDPAQSATCPLVPFLHPGGQPRTGVTCQKFQIREVQAGPGQPSIRVGVLGLVGPNAAQLSVATRKAVKFLGFQDQGTKAKYDEFHTSVQTMVNDLRRMYGCQLIMVLLHGGAPEDENLAKAVAGIDLVISAHTHAAYVKQVGRTLIAQSGHGGANLGVLDLEFGPEGLKLRNPGAPLLPIDDRVPAAPDVLTWLQKVTAEVDRVVGPAGFKAGDPICEVTRDRLKRRFPENAAVVFVADTLHRAVNRQLTTPVDFYFSSYGMVRSEFLTVGGRPTPYAFSDVFRFSPLGFDPAGRPGAPIVIFTLSPFEVKMVLEMMTMLSGKTPPYEPGPSSSLRYKVRRLGVPLVNKVGDLTLHGKPMRNWPKRVRIATTLFFAQNLLRIKDLTKGLLRITPRDGTGNPISEFADSGLPREHILLAEELRRVQDGEVDDPLAHP